MAAAGCDPCLSFASDRSGGRQEHFVFRRGQFRPQRQNHDSPVLLVLERVDVRAAFTKPEMTHSMRAVRTRVISTNRSKFSGIMGKSEETAARQPFESCRAVRVRAFWVKIKNHRSPPFLSGMRSPHFRPVLAAGS